MTRSNLSIVALGCMLAAAPAWAFRSTEQDAKWEIPRLGAPSQLVWESLAVSKPAGRSANPIEAFSQEYGGVWFYQVNRPTGTFHHVYGSGVWTGGVPASAEEAEALASNFIRDNQDLFSISEADLEVAGRTFALGKWSVVFQQTYKGLEVHGGRAHVVFTAAGRLFEMGSDVHPGIGISVSPSLTQDQALDIAGSDLGFDGNYDEVERSDLLVLPVETGAGGVDYRLAYRFDLRLLEPFGLWATYVDAHSGEILWRENQVRFADYIGDSRGDIEWDGYCDGYTAGFPLKNMRIDVSTAGTGYTDEFGAFLLSGSGGAGTITAELRGHWVNVDLHNGTDASHTGTITDGVPYAIVWDSSNSLPSERDVFAYVNRQHDWLKNIDPAFAGLDYAMPARVERTDLYCPGNAWWDGIKINLCYSASGYASTGRMSDVVYHEYGHGVTDFLYGPNDPPSDVHEANSDAGANFLTRSSVMGLGLYLGDCSSGIRDADNTLEWPCTGSPHYCGQVLAGFYWDSWQELLAAYPQPYADSVASNTWHFGRKLGLPQNQPDQVHWTFVADDDDGNLANGTPHYEEFCVGAANHGFDCPEITPGVSFRHVPLGHTFDTVNPYPVTAEITSTDGVIIEDSCRITYNVDGGAYLSVGMTATGNPDEYVGYIPPQPGCSSVRYHMYAADDQGYTAAEPASAPAELHGFLVGYEVVFEDDFENGKGWTAGFPGDGATTGIWERCDPEGTPAQAEDDHTPYPGVSAYITQCAAGPLEGSYDVDDGETTLISPVFDLSEYADARLTYRRWYSNDTGAEPGTDYWVVEITDDDWTTWATLENTNVSDRSWVLMEFDLGTYVDLTDLVQVRFIASDYGAGSLVEAGVDDFLLAGCPASEDTTPPTVTMLDPNGGERLDACEDSAYVIRWESSDDVGVVRTHILLSTDGGATYPDTLASGDYDSTWVWDFPGTNELRCRLRVVCLDAASNEAGDESDGDFEVVDMAGVARRTDLPAGVVLFQNRPSPFGSATEIEFGLPGPGRVELGIYDVQGRLVATLADGIFPGGYHVVTWAGRAGDGTDASDGVYFYRLTTPARSLARKMLLVR